MDYPVTGDSEFALVAYNASLNVTYVRDLGINISEFDGAQSLAAPIALTGWDSFRAALGNDLSGVRWGIVGGDGVSPIASYSTALRELGSTGGGTSRSNDLNQADLSGVNAAVANIMGVHNNAPTQSAVADGWSVNTDGAGLAFGQGNTLYGAGNNFNSRSGNVQNGTLADDLYFYSYTEPFVNGSRRTAYGNALGQGIWSLDEVNATLQYTAPVPEPGTYALMFAGLLTLGAVARRRSK
jgi:hypothetical protein